ncbi:MAG: hypothetical protein NTW65_06140 [Deltaproteobacteria bacterium]|nr:hypothetical protein [Deltaproteobacteria bacterium]
MFKNEDGNWARFRDLTKIMENVSPKLPSEYFTARVMARISDEKEAVQSFSLGQLFSTNLKVDFQHSVTKTECAFYFLLTGFFYFILGLIMIISLPLPAILPGNGWLSIQPFLGLLLAAELSTLGIAVYTNGDSAVRFVRAGTLLYATLIILNGWLGALYLKVYVAIIFTAIFSVTGLVIALLLGLAVDRYHPETIFSEVRG